MKKLLSKQILCLAIIFLNAPKIISAEIDHFTYFGEPIQDSTEIINQATQRYLEEAVEMSNLWPQTEITVQNFRQTKDERYQELDGNSNLSCTDKKAEKLLYKKIKLFFNSGLFNNEFFNFYFNTPLIDRLVYTKENSIYAKWNIFSGMLLAFRNNPSKGDVLAPLMKYNNIVIGTDKFEHFFGRGTTLYNNFYNKRMSFKRIMRKDHWFEKWVLGGNTLMNGVFSFADLVANFNGMRFWNHVLQNYNDIISADYNIGPYVKCNVETGKWYVNPDKPFKLDFYVDDGWNEAINCSMYPSKSAYRKVMKHLALLEEEKQISMSCPMMPEPLNQIIDKYGRFGAFLLNKHGIGKKSSRAYFNNYGRYERSFEKKKVRVKQDGIRIKILNDNNFNLRLNKEKDNIERVYY